MHILCVLSIPLRKIFHKGCIPPLHTNFNDCIYVCLVNRNQSLGDAFLVILISNSEIFNKYSILYLYNNPLSLAHSGSLFWPFSLFDIIELHAFYVGHH